MVSTIDAARSEYLEHIAGVCPWDHAREESALTSFCAWLTARPDQLDDLDALKPALAGDYAEQRQLSAEQFEVLLGALAGLYRWATRDGRAVSNPFAAAYELTREEHRAAMHALPA